MEKGATPELTKEAHKQNIPVLTYPGVAKLTEKVSEFYESLYDGVENEDDSEA